MSINNGNMSEDDEDANASEDLPDLSSQVDQDKSGDMPSEDEDEGDNGVCGWLQYKCCVLLTCTFYARWSLIRAL